MSAVQKAIQGKCVEISTETESKEESNDTVIQNTTEIQQPIAVPLEDYKCAICKEYPAPIILQCDFGHILCAKCFPLIQNRKCPVCRIELRFIRNRIAEKELQTKNLKCEHCHYHGIIDNIQDHMRQHHMTDYLNDFRFHHTRTAT